MKNVPIKFRGVDIETGEYVYGECYTLCVPFFHFVDELGEHHNVEVDSDSICQLVGYDMDGKEVYEGDTLELIKIEYTIYTIKAKLEANVNLSMFRKVDDNV